MALRAALQASGRRGDPVVLWDAATVVYRVGDVVAKVYSPTATVDRYARAASAAARLGTLGLPVVAPLDGGTLFHHEAGTVGFWPYVTTVRDPSWADLGHVLGELHRAAASAVDDFDLPRWTGSVGTRWATEPYRARSDARTDVADAIDAAAIGLAERAGQVVTTEAATVIHGDAQLKNVLVGAGGPRLIDFDWTEIGPAIVDTASVVHARRQGTATQAACIAFDSAYGAPVSRGETTDVLCALKHLSGVVFRLAMDCRRGEPVDWLPAAAASFT